MNSAKRLHSLLGFRPAVCSLMMLAVLGLGRFTAEAAAQAQRAQQNAQAAAQNQAAQGQQAAQQPAAANYQTVPLHASLDGDDPQERAAVSNLRNKVYGVLRGTAPYNEASKGEFSAWYRNYVFPKMTQPQYFFELADNRTTVLKNLQDAKSAAVHRDLRDLAFSAARVIMQGNYHPASRYNAALLLAELNEIEGTLTGSAKALPRPMSAALDLLIQEYQNPNQIDVVRIGALAGILRHVNFDRQIRQNNLGELLTQEKRNTIEQLAMSLLNSEPPEGRAPEAHTWMQRRAIDILGGLGSAGANGEVATTLNGIVGDGNQPLSLRLTSARALGQLSYANTPDVGGNAVYNLTLLAAQACRSELARLEEERKHQKLKQQLKSGGASSFAAGYGGEGSYGGMAGPAGMGMGMGMPGEEMMGGGEDYGEMASGEDMYGYGMPGMSGMPGAAQTPKEDPKLKNARRRVKYQVQSVQIGLGKKGDAPRGVGQLRGTSDDAFQKASQAFDSVMKATDDNADTLDNFMVELQKKVQELEQLARQIAPASAAPPEEVLENSTPG